MASDVTSCKVALYSMSTGAWVRDLALKSTIGPTFFPTYLVQSKDLQLYIQAYSDGKIVHLDPNKPSTIETISIGANRGIATTTSSFWYANTSWGIDNRDRTTWTQGNSFGTTVATFGLQGIDDRWVVATNATGGQVWLVDSTGAQAVSTIYDGAQIFDVNLASNGRLLVADQGNNSVFELTPSKQPSDTDPLGLPMAVGRTVTVLLPLGAAELTTGSWLVGGSKGLFVYSPATGLLESTVSTNSFRAIEYYEGP
jgi:ligand-binding sensor domain-containing protein